MILYLLAFKYELSSQFQPKRPYCVGLDEKNHSVQMYNFQVVTCIVI